LLPHRKLTISITLAKTKVIFCTADVVCLKKTTLKVDWESGVST